MLRIDYGYLCISQGQSNLFVVRVGDDHEASRPILGVRKRVRTDPETVCFRLDFVPSFGRFRGSFRVENRLELWRNCEEMGI